MGFGILCASLVLASSIPHYAVTPFPEGVGSFANGLYFVLLAGVGATLLYLLLKRKKMKTISIIIGFAITIAILLLSVVYLSALFSLVPISSTIAFVSTVALGISVTILADLAIFKVQGRISNVVILLLGGGLGAFLGVSIPVYSAIVILAFLAIYDIYAVYRGPVGKMAQQGLEELHGLSFYFRDFQMGLGDLTFYSMLTAVVLTTAGPILCAASAVGILGGVLIVLKMLEKRGMFPGLPFPVFLGLLPLIVFLLR